MEAKGATIQLLKTGGGDPCPGFVKQSPDNPTQDQIIYSDDVSLDNGQPTNGTGKITKVFTGNQTVLVSVQDSKGLLFMRACRTGKISGGGSYQLELSFVGASMPDMSMPDLVPTGADLQPDMVPPADLSPLKTLAVTVTEVRAPTRKIENAAVTVIDSADVATTAVNTDAMGVAKIATAGLTPPLRVLVQGADGTSGYAGFVEIAGITPTFTNDQASLVLPLELNPPDTSAANTITATVAGEDSAYDVYWLGTNEISADIKTAQGNAATTTTIPDLIAGGQYRIAIVDRAPSVRIATPTQVSAIGSSFNPASGDFKAVSHQLDITLNKSSNSAFNTEHAYAALLTLPASTTQAAIPLVPYTTYTTSGAQNDKLVVQNPSSVHPSAILFTEMSATGTGVFSVVRHQLVSPTPAADSFANPVPDPPTVGDLSTVTTASTAFDITATPPPTNFQLSSGYLHIRIKDSLDKTHAHVIAPAASPITVHIPAILPAGTYSIDVDFVKNFTLPGGTVATTLADDWTKLIRPIPEVVARRTVALTLN